MLWASTVCATTSLPLGPAGAEVGAAGVRAHAASSTTNNNSNNSFIALLNTLQINLRKQNAPTKRSGQVRQAHGAKPAAHSMAERRRDTSGKLSFIRTVPSASEFHRIVRPKAL